MFRVLVVLAVAASGLATMGAQAATASTGLPGHRCLAPVRATVHGRALRSSAPVGRTSACPATAARGRWGSLLLPVAQPASSAYNGGSPPLSLHGGSVMGTTTPGEVTITPIVWTPPGFTAPSASYVSHLAQFDDDLAAASDERDTVFSTLTEYTNAAGVHLVDRMHVAAPITSTDALASSGTISGETVVGCHQDAGTLTGAEGDQYAYRGCVTDVQIMAEVEAVRARLALPDDAGHLYPVFLPKGLESCFGAKNGAGGGDCSLNASSNASQYCAYHSSVAASGGAVYAVEPFPIRSVVGGSCDLGWVEAGAVQSPSGDVAFDSVASGYSHELAEAITDPFSGGWFDSTNNENGDECAYTVPGSLSGTAGAHYDQTINGHHYLLQAEFSNLAYAWNPQAGCQLSATTPAPQISALSAAEAQVADQVVVTGTALGGAPIVAVNGQPATIVSASDTSVAFTVPAGATTGPVTVQTIAGTATSTATLAIVVSAAPTFTSSATFGASVGQPMAATITTAGYPTPSIATTDPLPGGITLTDEGDGTARLSGTPSGAPSGAGRSSCGPAARRGRPPKG